MPTSAVRPSPPLSSLSSLTVYLSLDLGFVETPKVEGDWTVAKALAVAPNDTGDYKPPSNSPLPFFHMLERLKTTKREGWRRFGIER